MRGADALVKCLQAEGVKFIAGITSGSTLEISDAALAAPGIKSILTRHERVAGDMADGYARVSGQPGVCMAVKGPGAAHIFASLAQSYSDAVPVLAILGQTTRARLGARDVQEMQLQDAFRTVTKWETQINMPRRVPEMMRRAFSQLRNGRPGPVMLELPSDVMLEEFDDSLFAYRPAPAHLAYRPSAAAIEEAADLLVAAKRPLIYAGSGVLQAQAMPELVRVAELLSAPVMSTLGGKSAFPENHQLSLGLGGFPVSNLGTPMSLKFSQQTDCLLAVGNTFSDQATRVKPWPAGVKLIHSNVDYFEINHHYPTDVGLVGNAKLTLADLIAALEDRLPKERRGVKADVVAEVAKEKQAWLDMWMPKLTSDEVPLNPFRITWDFMHAVDRSKTILTHDAGAVRGHSCHHYEAIIPYGFVGMGRQSEMGWSLGAAMGMKVANPDKLVAYVIGDGSFGMTGLDLETAVRNQIPTLTLLYNNSSMGIVMDLQKKSFGERYTMVELGGDYLAIARALGAYAERVETPDQIVPAIKRAVAKTEEGVPAVVEFMTKKLEPQPRPDAAPGTF
ncbi:MAG: thiamine pyrophosphate-dependent enzyme [Chloroflexota bacterium]